MFSRILLLSLPSAVWSANNNVIAAAPQSLAKFKELYNLEKAGDLTTPFKILEYNNALRGSSAPPSTVADAGLMWDWYSAVTGPKKNEANEFLNQVEKDNLVHEQLLSTFVTDLNKVLAGTNAATSKNDAINLKGLLGDTKPVTGTPTEMLADTVTAWETLKNMNAADKAKALEMAKNRMYEKWVALFKVDFAALDDYAKMTQCFAETLQDKDTEPASDAKKGKTNWNVYSRMPTDIQSKMAAHMLQKMKTRIIA